MAQAASHLQEDRDVTESGFAVSYPPTWLVLERDAVFIPTPLPPECSEFNCISSPFSLYIGREPLPDRDPTFEGYVADLRDLEEGGATRPGESLETRDIMLAGRRAVEITHSVPLGVPVGEAQLCPGCWFRVYALDWTADNALKIGVTADTFAAWARYWPTAEKVVASLERVANS
jgi:hypothetical protein